MSLNGGNRLPLCTSAGSCHYRGDLGATGMSGSVSGCFACHQKKQLNVQPKPVSRTVPQPIVTLLEGGVCGVGSTVRYGRRGRAERDGRSLGVPAGSEASGSRDQGPDVAPDTDRPFSSVASGEPAWASGSHCRSSVVPAAVDVQSHRFAANAG